mmetsp:Transcript_16963/g.50870  ORF Transcript_16963/g.50870 Transcript_16963/m.50870 type:complete len:247 (+) Transcript_16963:330-1070(+)
MPGWSCGASPLRLRAKPGGFRRRPRVLGRAARPRAAPPRAGGDCSRRRRRRGDASGSSTPRTPRRSTRPPGSQLLRRPPARGSRPRRPRPACRPWPAVAGAAWWGGGRTDGCPGPTRRTCARRADSSSDCARGGVGVHQLRVVMLGTNRAGQGALCRTTWQQLTCTTPPALSAVVARVAPGRARSRRNPGTHSRQRHRAPRAPTVAGGGSSGRRSPRSDRSQAPWPVQRQLASPPRGAAPWGGGAP